MPARISAPAIAPAVPCDADCPVQKSARILDGKWTILLIRDLLGGTRRYSELKRSLAGISPRMLASRLKFLAAQGIIIRKVYPVVPPRTEYSLTESGRRLRAVIGAMADYGRSLPPPNTGPTQS